MRHLAKALAALVAVVWLAPAAARADIPPPDGYQESCTRERQEGTNEYCKLYSASYKDPWGCSTDSANSCTDASQGKEVCCAAWIAAGWTYRCKTYGASAFQAMWCRARQPTDPPKPDGKVSPGDSKVTSDSKVPSADSKAPSADGKVLPPKSDGGCAVSGTRSVAPLLILALPLLAGLVLRRRR